MSSTATAQELSIRRALQAAMEHHDAGRLAQAEAIYREILQAAPDRPEALALLGGLANATGRGDEALDLLGRAIRLRPSIPQFHNQLGLALEGLGRVEEAAAAYRRALALKPDFAHALFNLGNALRAQGRGEEAIACYRRALAAHPDYAAASNNLGVALEEQGRMDEALVAYRAALDRDERPESRANFARCVALAQRLPADPGLRALVARALGEAWARPADLARTAITLLQGEAAPGQPIEAAALARDRLLLALLENAQVCDPGLERFLTDARRALLESALGPDPHAPEAGLDFHCALARQCFLGDYVFACDAGESARVAALRQSLGAALESGADILPSRLAALAAYVPLATLPGADSLPDRPWPEAVRALIVQQVLEPRTERMHRERIASMSAVRHEVSRQVRLQYEENPYPRWVATPAAEPLALETHLRRLFPRAAIPPRERDGLEILVAGCGTGQEPVDLARRYAHARILAIDLSRASLAYAKRKSGELGLANIEYAQADILELEPSGRAFDLVSSVGVLHHLADPQAGWRRLLALLRPGGYMQVGLYSEIARRDIAAARAFIAARGLEPSPEGIRRARAALRAEPRFAGVTALRDFYGMNECRDLLFHVQEHRFTLPQLRGIVQALGVELVGLAVPPAVRREYARRFPRDARQIDLESWDAFEREFPDTFAGMYLFWVRKGDEA